MDVRHGVAALAALADLDVEALALVVAGDSLDAALAPSIRAMLDDAVATGDLVLAKGKVIDLFRPAGVKARRVVVAVAADESPKAFRAALSNALGPIKSSGARTVAVGRADAKTFGDRHAEAAVLAIGDAAYLYRHSKPSAPAAWTPESVTVLSSRADAKSAQAGIRRGNAIAAGVAFARELANRPANLMTPIDLAQAAKKMGKETGVEVEILDRKAIEKIGMGSFLSVAQGSDEPPRFIVAEYKGAAGATPPVVLVGKGITFDTGGISIKPAAEMDEMKFDMGGAAGVLGALLAIALLKPKLNLVVLVPATENMPSGKAVKPGDVVKSLSGQTIEILNTDAEGRLVLCDALTYAAKWKPKVVVDVATLTGACVIALGHHNSGLFTADDAIAARMAEAAQASLDPCWRLPLDDEYDEALKSNFADMANVGGRPGGAITAAMFLKRYTAAYPWAHLDIAGTAWKGGQHKGSTGRPVGLLTHFVLGHARA